MQGGGAVSAAQGRQRGVVRCVFIVLCLKIKGNWKLKCTLRIFNAGLNVENIFRRFFLPKYKRWVVKMFKFSNVTVFS